MCGLSLLRDSRECSRCVWASEQQWVPTEFSQNISPGTVKHYTTFPGPAGAPGGSLRPESKQERLFTHRKTRQVGAFIYSIGQWEIQKKPSGQAINREALKLNSSNVWVLMLKKIYRDRQGRKVFWSRKQALKLDPRALHREHDHTGRTRV